MTPVTLITGASSGIGAELARVFASHGHELALVARRQRELTDLAEEIASKGARRPIVVAVDLAERGAVARVVAELKSRDREPAYLINNAGFGLVGPSTVLDRGEQLAMIDVNVRALTELTLTFVESIVRYRGGILNVASIVSFMPGPGMAVYYASKAFVLSFSEALHSELSGRGVRVTALCPGPVATGFQSRAGIRAGTGGETTILALQARRVAEIGYDALMRGKRVIVAGLGNKIVVFFMRYLPHALLMPMIRTRLRFASKANA
ncbi:MAG TPA: SDR family oxidoreductase [Xanthobacteraceae bacterium]|nr:SDR family oxidoreductase [Xanthobacteraceae bacterium]